MRAVRSHASTLFAIGFSALATSGGTARADVVPFDKLAVVSSPTTGAPNTSLAEVPATIPATEHVEGIFDALAPAAERKQTEERGYRLIGVFTSDAQARAYALEGTFNPSSSREGQPGTCLSTGGAMQPVMRLVLQMKEPEPPKPTEVQIALLKKEHRWPPPAKPPATKASRATAPRDVVQRVRLERLIREADAITVESIDAFIDLQTLGTRLASKTSAKLPRVVAGPNALGVFAARDEGGHAQFLVTSPELPQPPTPSDRQAQLEALSGTANTLIAQIPSNTTTSIGCGRVRFTLSAKPGVGEMATVLATAFLPPSVDPEEGPATNDSDGDGKPDEVGFVSQQAVRLGMRKQRARAMAVNVSLSQLTTEVAPLLSVTFGWAGKDQKLTF